MRFNRMQRLLLHSTRIASNAGNTRNTGREIEKGPSESPRSGHFLNVHRVATQ